MSAFPHPLKGLKILDLSLLLPGPYCTALLSSFGADIIKIEPPGIGDPVRLINEGIYKQFNRDKKSVVLDLKSASGKETFKKLASQADAVIEGFRPGVMDKLGIGYQTLKENNAKLVFCSLSGFGQDGPYKNRPAHDLNFLGLAGYYSVPSQLEDKKARPNVRLADLAAGQFAAFSMSMALVQAKESGQGCHVDTSIFDAIASLSAPMIFSAKNIQQMAVEDYKHVMADSDLFETADNRYISIGTLEDKFWFNLATVLGETTPELLDEKYHTRRGRDGSKQELYSLIKLTFLTKTLAEWDSCLSDVETTWAPVYEKDEMLSDPHFIARGLTQSPVSNDTPIVSFPVKFSGERDRICNSAPKLGEHTRMVLQEFQFSDHEIETLIANKTVFLTQG